MKLRADLASVSADEASAWVRLCLSGRKKGASPDEVARVAKALRRLLPAVADCLAEPESSDDDFTVELSALSRG